MAAQRFLLPAEFRRRIVDAGAAEDPAVWVSAIREAWGNRHPELVKVHSRAYAVPVRTALALYRLDRSRYRRIVASALGPVGAQDFWWSMAVSAREGFACGDWGLLGWLAFQADAALAAPCRAEDDDRPPAPWPHGPACSAIGMRDDGKELKGGAVIQAFRRALSVRSGMPPADAYLTAALAYFRAVPETFLVPPDLVGYAGHPSSDSPQGGSESPDEATGEETADAAPPSAASWPCLRMFWSRNRWAWKQSPHGLAALAKNPNPFVALLAGQLRDCQEPVPKRPARPVRMRNPFARLLDPKGTEIDEPEAPLAPSRSLLSQAPSSVDPDQPQDCLTFPSDSAEPPCPPPPRRCRPPVWRRVGDLLGRVAGTVSPGRLGASRRTSSQPASSKETERAEP